MTTPARLGRLGLVVALLIAAMTIGRLARPDRVLACYCVPPETVAAYRTDVDVVIVAGTVIGLEFGALQLAIDRLYKGPIAGPVMPIKLDTSSCGIRLDAGDRVIFAAKVQNGKLAPNVCMSWGRLDNEGGAALLADVEAVFGTGVAMRVPTAVAAQPVDTPAGAAQAVDTSTGPDIALPLTLAALAITVMALFAGLVLLARRRRPAASR